MGGMRRRRRGVGPAIPPIDVIAHREWELAEFVEQVARRWHGSLPGAWNADGRAVDDGSLANCRNGHRRRSDDRLQVMVSSWRDG